MKQKQSSIAYMGFRAIMIAPFFLFFPDYSVIDFLPDLFAYILVLLAIRKLRDISDVIGDAARGFRMLLISTGARLVMFFVLFSVINEQERPTLMLLLAFCFAVYEFIYGLPAWSRLFDGMAQLAQTGEGSAVLSKKAVGLKKITIGFLVIRYVLAILPEFSIFSEQKYDDSAYDWSQFTALFRMVAMFTVLVLGIVWLVIFLRRMGKICKDSVFFDACRTKYENEIISRPWIFTRRHIGSTLILVCITFLLSTDIYLDNINILSDALFFGMAIITFLSLKRYSKHVLPGIVLSCLGIAASVTGQVLSYSFHQRYTDVMVQRLPEAWNRFWSYAIPDAISSVIYIAVSGLLLIGVGKLIDGHCGYIPETMSPEYRENKLKEIRKSLKKRLIVCFCFACLTGITGVMYDYMITYNGMAISDLWMPACIVLAVGTFIAALSASFEIKSEADSRYMLN